MKNSLQNIKKIRILFFVVFACFLAIVALCIPLIIYVKKYTDLKQIDIDSEQF